MRSTDIIDALGNVGDDLVSSAEERKRKNTSFARKIAILAAAVCIIAVSVMIPLFSALNNSENKNNTVLNSDGKETETDETKGSNGNLSYTVLTSDSQGDAIGKMLSTRVVSASVNSRVEADKMFDIYVGASDVPPNRDNVRFVLNIRAGDKEEPLFPYNLEDKKVINAFSFEGVNGEYEEILYDRGVINTSSKVVFEMTSGGIPSKEMSAIRVAPVDIEKYPIGSICITFASFRLDDQGEVIKDKYSYGGVGTTLYYAVSDGIIGFSFRSVEDALNNARSCETKSMYDDPFAGTRDNSRYSECCPVEPTNTSISGIGYEIDEPISLEFGIIDGMMADKYQVVVNGDYSSVNIDNSVIPSTNEDKHFTVSFVPKPNEDGRMVIRISAGAYLNGECVNFNAKPICVYMVVYNDKIYLSYSSFECALPEAGIPVELDFITLEKSDKDAKAPNLLAVVTSSGTIRWIELENSK